jgi:hypothetical protein
MSYVHWSESVACDGMHVRHDSGEMSPTHTHSGELLEVNKMCVRIYKYWLTFKNHESYT